MLEPQSKSSLVKKTILLPNVKFEQFSVNLLYYFNPDHQSSYVESLFTKIKEDSSSWILVGGYMHSNIGGMEDFNQLNLINNVEVSDVEIQSFQFRLAYSRNWYWTNYYVGAATALGSNINSMSETTTSSETIREVDDHMNVAAMLSAGYIGQSFSWGTYTQLTQTSYKFSNLLISSNIGRTGLNFSYLF